MMYDMCICCMSNVRLPYYERVYDKDVGSADSPSCDSHIIGVP